MMNIYDKAHELARVMRDSQEYQAFLTEKKKIDADAQAKKMVKDFMAKKLELEYEALSGKGEDKAKMEQLQKMYEVVSINANARDFLHAQMRFQQIMGDVYKILGESVAEGLDFLGHE